MTKRELIDAIRELNSTAQPEFLASFEEDDLRDYLQQLREVERHHRHKSEYALTH